ncbi:MAG: TolC family protein [Paludibacteraceae bacterium]|nr:TolC family protein [Paludibacteraceae bacterium]
MKRLKNIFAALAVSFVLTGCGIYSKYEQNMQIPADATGTEHASPDGSVAETPLSWRDFFTDPLLQQLIDSALSRNTDINSARIAVEKSEVSLRAARLAYLPSLYFSPSGTIASFDGSPASKSYNLPLQLSMDIDAFGALTNKKRASKAVLMQTRAQEEIVRTNLISTVAQQYNMLLMLDRQLEILTATDSLWNASLETQKSLWENGKSYSTAVNQMESSYINVKTQIVDTRRNIRSVENSLCRLLAVAPQAIPRNRWGEYALPQQTFSSVPSALLLNRPDVRMADHVMEEAFYNTQAARSAFYPSISLTGTAGWTNNAGSVVVNPGKLLLNAVASLTQPIFTRGRLKANLKIAKLTQEDVQRKYVQTVINAGNQVNEAMADCQASYEKNGYYRRQVEVLHDAYTGTHELMDNGKANYLEVLTAQETLLNAQLSEAVNMYSAAQAVIALYIALGGGTK